METVTPRTHDTCTVPGCGREHDSQGLCHGHYAAWKRTGTWPTALLKQYGPAAAAERFWEKVEKGDGCWLWQGATDGGARYGSFLYEGRVQRAHRVSLALAGTTVPDDMDVDHLCRVTLCVRPDHLEVVTHRTNVLRGESLQAINATKTHCPAGHPYDEANTYVMPGGGRACRACNRATGAERQRRHRARKKAAG